MNKSIAKFVPIIILVAGISAYFIVFARSNNYSKEIVISNDIQNIQEKPEEIVREFQENTASGENISPKLSQDPTKEELEKYGIKELIGQGVSDFKGSPKNRISNIEVGASKFNGVLISPGEEFSFIKTLGDVDASTGYLPEMVIKANETIPEYGGGLCQVSTTIFRAALNSGLKITSRSNHAYAVQYYKPIGLDATVYIPKPDFMFVNDTPNYIFVKTRIEGTQLFFDFFGASDGRQTKIVGPKVLEKNSDGSMKTVVYQEVYDTGGNLLRKSEFESNYKSASLYPHPGEKITKKPDDWSQKQWREYKKANGI
jgi:vancomycin resistance protein YoaR